MTLPTAKEVFEAIGFTLGRWRQKLPAFATVRSWAYRVGTIAAAGLVVYLLPTLPAIPTLGAWALFATGVFLFGAAAFCYVLFSFLLALAKVSPQVQTDLQTMIAKVAHPLRAYVAPQPPTEGAFTSYDDETGYLQEQFEELKRMKILNEEDTLQEVLGENKDFDFDAIKAKARGE